MQTKNIVIGVVAVLALIFGVSYLKQTTVVNQVNVPEQKQNLGATPGNVVDSKYFSIGGQEFFQSTFPIQASSSVICSVLNPFAPATTTIYANGIGLNITRGLIGTNTIDISTSSTAYASSSPAFTRGLSVASSAELTYPWAPRYGTTTLTTAFTPADGAVWQIADTVNANYPYILKGTEYLTWRIATATPGVGTYGGTCSFLGRKL